MSDLTREQWIQREHDYRASLDDDAFWAHVLGGDQPGEPEAVELDEISNQDTPCTECGEHGACATDFQGRELFHKQRDDDEDSDDDR